MARFFSWLLHRAMERVELPQLLEQFLVKSIRWIVMIAGTIVALTALEISVESARIEDALRVKCAL